MQSGDFKKAANVLFNYLFVFFFTQILAYLFLQGSTP